jgi:endo-1,4-beta-xylanase
MYAKTLIFEAHTHTAQILESGPIMNLIICLLALVSGPESLPAIAELPDPFLFDDGRRVASPEEWPARRGEMLELLLKYEYGHVPPAPGNVALDAVLESGARFEGASDFQSVRIKFGPEQFLSTTLHLYLPAKASGPLPLILRFGLGGEHAPAANSAGFAFACLEQTSLDPDTEGHDEVGPAQAAYADYDWGSVAVWAWCASRALDYLVTLPKIDPKQTVITGHSRTGKAALLAGALDERFAFVVPNGSGAGGAAVYRHAPKGVETLKLITEPARFKSWFQADFGQFGDAVERLPFDQHFLRAIIAPRPVLSTDALGDQWANPEGTQLGWIAAQPVYDFLGAPENNLIHVRAGGHDQLAEDFDVLLKAARALFDRRPMPSILRSAPYSES